MSVCEFCGTKMLEFDGYGNEFLHCPNDCSFWDACVRFTKEEAEKSPEQRQSEYDDYMAAVGQQADLKITNCWHCQRIFTRTEQNQDVPYGNFCPECNHSLRYHPIYGEGGPEDMKWKAKFLLAKVG